MLTGGVVLKRPQRADVLCWLERTKALLDIPANLDVLAILPFGYPARALGRGKKQRKALSEVAHLERYGHPFA